MPSPCDREAGRDARFQAPRGVFLCLLILDETYMDTCRSHRVEDSMR